MKVVALAGGVGGAKLAYGLYHSMDGDDLTIVVNTGDDFYHYGLYISPDVDTVCYTLAGEGNPETGWGLRNETWNVYEQLKKIGGPDWFRLGDGDLATHLERTRRLQDGESLSDITRHFCRVWGIDTTILPMTDQPVQTMVNTVEYGQIPFQEYFVKYQHKPKTTGYTFAGIDSAKPVPGFIQAVEDADVVIICPSNPFVSIQPIISLSGVQQAVTKKNVIAVSPIIAGKALKGPAAKMFQDQGYKPSVFSVAKYYEDFLTGIVMDNSDADQQKLIEQIGIICLRTDTLMNNSQDRIRLAQDVLRFCGYLGK